MSKTARRARIAAVIKSLCERFPQTFNRNGPRPLKVGVYSDALAALGGAAEPRDLQSALRAYTSNASYLRALAAGACRVDLDGNPAGSRAFSGLAAMRSRGDASMWRLVLGGPT
jgi:ProP effector